MGSLVELMAELSTACYNLGSSHWVEVTHINRPDDFYVRLTAYKSHLRKLEEYEGPVEASKLRLGSVVIFMSQTVKHHVRGQIRNIREDGDSKICDLFALDYGFIEPVSSDCLKSPKREGLPALTVQCQLSLCQPRGGGFDQKATDAMIFYVGKEPAKMIVKGQTANKLIVQLINTCPEDISTMLALSEDSTFYSGNNSANRFSCPPPSKLYYVYKKVQVGDSIPVRVQSGESLQSFYVSDIKDYRDYVAGHSDLSMYLRLETDMRPEDVTAGKPVAVYNGYKYERAIIKEVTIPEEKAVVQLVDFGKLMEIDIQSSRLKSLNREYYFTRPVLAIYCSTDDKQAWNNGLPRFLYPGYEFIITIKEVGKDIDTPNIVNITKLSK